MRIYSWKYFVILKFNVSKALTTGQKLSQNSSCIYPLAPHSLKTIEHQQSLLPIIYTEACAKCPRGVCVTVQTHNRLKPPWRAGCEEWRTPRLPYWRYQIQLLRARLWPVTWTTITLSDSVVTVHNSVPIHLVLLPEAGWQHTRPLSDLRGRNGIMVPKCRLKRSIDLNQRCKEFEEPKRCVCSQDYGHCQGLLLPLMFLIHWCFGLPRLSGEIPCAVSPES